MTKISEMTVDQLTVKKHVLDGQIDELRTELRKIEGKLSRKVSILKTVNEQLDQMTLKEDDIESLLEYFPETQDRRKKRSDFLRKSFLSAEAYFPDTGQACVRIALLKNDSNRTKIVHKALLELLPYIKPLKNGEKYIDIFEHTLSEFDSYHLSITENSYRVVGRRYGGRVLFEDEDLMKVLTHIQEKYYYE